MSALPFESLRQISEFFVKCPTCGDVWESTPDTVNLDVEITLTDQRGVVLSREAWEHYCSFRVRCHSCSSTDFCRSCMASPYHTGYTCTGVKEYAAVKRCRYCESSGECTDEDCVARRGNACFAVLKCGHECMGVYGESDHMPCLRPECSDEKTSNCEDFCNICFTESIKSAPAVMLDCGHMYHYHCVLKKITAKWPGQRITFSFLDCPLCKVKISHPHPEIQAQLKTFTTLHQDIRNMASSRLKIEKEILNDPKVTAQGSQYFGRPLDFAMATFAYYNCFKCTKVYFGGRRDCDAGDNQEAKDLICVDCSTELSGRGCANNAHREYWQYKCRFCCSPSTWFCFGTTHFCDKCHKPEMVAKITRDYDNHPVCPGPTKCPLRCVHPVNSNKVSSEFVTGCAICADKLITVPQSAPRESRDVSFAMAVAAMVK